MKNDTVQTPDAELPEDLRRLAERLKERGIGYVFSPGAATLPLPELVQPLQPGAALSDAVLAEREEWYRGA